MSGSITQQLPDLDSGPRHFITTDQDHGGIALVICILMAIYTVLCLILRIYMRATVSGPFGKDDIMCTIATIFGVIQVSVSATAVHFGFGKTLILLTPSEVVHASKAVYAAQLLYIITNALTKCTVALLLSRIVHTISRVRACYGVLILSSVWGLGSFLASAIRCTEYDPWSVYGDRCPNLLLVWQIITALNIFIEVGILAMPFWLVWDLQTYIWRKATIVCIFSLRSPVIVFAALRLHYLDKTLGSTEALFDALVPFIFLNLEMHYGLMAATMPTLKAFVGAFNTQWGTVDTQGLSGYGQSSSGSYALHSLENRSNKSKPRSDGSKSRSRRHLSKNSTVSDRDNGDFANCGKNFVHVTSSTGNERCSDEESHRMIIRQTVTCEIHVESMNGMGSEGDVDSIDFVREAPPVSPAVVGR